MNLEVGTVMLAKSTIAGGEAEELRIFYSYARLDTEPRQAVDSLLAEYPWEVAIRPWYDGEIQPGSPWDQEITRQIQSADIILLFVTKRFMQSKYCNDVEVPLALLRQREGKSRVVPIIFEETEPTWKEAEFSYLQALPTNGKPIDAWSNRTEALEHVVQELINLIVRDGLAPEMTRRWELELKGHIAEFPLTERARAVQRLRERTLDKSLRITGTREGSIILSMESSQNGLNKVQELYASGELDGVIGHPVLRVRELFGAGLHAGSHSVSGFDFLRPSVLPSDSLMLLPSEKFDTIRLLGMSLEVSRLNPTFQFHLGDTKRGDVSYAGGYSKCVDYFLTSVSVPDDDQFVNLAPDPSARMLSPMLAGTQLGRDLLDQDLQLKRLSASLLHPDTQSGREFWGEVRGTLKQGGYSSHTPIDTFQRILMRPNEATVYEGSWESLGHAVTNPGSEPLAQDINAPLQAIILKQHIKTLCDGDYLPMYAAGGGAIGGEGNRLCAEVFKKIILPIIEKEVNEGRTFAPMRQILSAMILATWLKKNQHRLPEWQKYVDSGNVSQLNPRVENIEPFQRPTLAGESETKAMLKPEEKPVIRNLHDAWSGEFELGVKVRGLGDIDRSRMALKRAYEARLYVYGNQDVRTLVAAEELGKTFQAAGDMDSAIFLYKAVLEARLQTLGERHQDSLMIMQLLERALLSKGNHLEARRLQAQIAMIRMRISEEWEQPDNREYLKRYLDLFANGVFYLERQEYDRETKGKIARAYLAGAIDFRNIDVETIRVVNPSVFITY